jgi:DNA-binding LacI/PurR family transcriptional regulator
LLESRRFAVHRLARARAAVAAFDDFDWATLLTPPITIVDQHIELVGRTTGSKLLGLLSEISESGATPTKVVIGATLKAGESCGAWLTPEERPGAGEARGR